MTKLLRIFKGDLAINLVRTFIARAMAALGSLFLLFVVGRYYGPSGVGTLAIAQSLFLGAGVLAKYGMDNTLVKYVGQSPDSIHALTYLNWALRRSFYISIGFSFALIMSRTWLESLFGASGLQGILWGISLAVPGFSAAWLLSGFFKGVRMPATACLMENGMISLLAGLVIWLLWEYPSRIHGYSILGVGYLIAAYLVLLQGAVQLEFWRRSRKLVFITKEKARRKDNDFIKKANFWATSHSFFAANLAMFMQNVLAIMLAGWLLSSADLGLFKTAQQVGMLIAFILLVVNAIFPTRFSSLYENGDITELSRMAKIGATVGIVFVVPLVLVCILWPSWVLSWFGEGFSGAAQLLRVIALGQMVRVATGSVDFLLSMTGHEKLMRNIALICNTFSLIGFFFFIKLFGVMGAAFALSFALAFQNLTALYFVWVKLGIWTLPTPNLFLWLRVRTQAKVCG